MDFVKELKDLSVRLYNTYGISCDSARLAFLAAKELERLTKDLATYEQARAALTAKAVPAGFVLAKASPTAEMMRAGCAAIHWYEQEATARAVYAAMLAATPAPAPEADCWACDGTRSVTTSSNGSGLIDEACQGCATPAQAQQADELLCEALPPLPEAANDNRQYGRAGFCAPYGPCYTADQMHDYARAVESVCAEAWGVKLAGQGKGASK